MSMQYLEYAINTKLIHHLPEIQIDVSGHPVFSLETLVEIPSCVLTDQKFPRSVIPVLQITASHKTCYNRLIHCKTMGLEQAAHSKVSGWS